MNARYPRQPACSLPAAPAEKRESPHRISLTRDSLAALLQTVSFYLTLDPAGRADLLGRVDEVVLRHPHLIGRESFELPYVTRCWRATRR